ncbi:Glycogen phosphorylase [Sandaracinus amylolyticus]|uniref:Alpha-1,4 glucan phosphorylase n=2 Tax=Sandaracinus amylolyticus TaxID=927083 RepID=A0A0F6W1Z6_9BACT|nr:Glycogen phosphorylase [Sandaracinus amylolyticus]
MRDACLRDASIRHCAGMKIREPIPGAPLPVDQPSIKQSIVHHLAHTRMRDQYRASASDVFHAVARAVRDRIADRWLGSTKSQWDDGKKRVYYLSMEYLPGRLLRDAVLNLGIESEVRGALTELGLSYDDVLETEADPGLGNGGLGRLASCFLDSMATLGIAGTGYGIRYDYGMFRQAIVGGAQVEEPDTWLLHGSPWETSRTETTYTVRYEGRVEPRVDPTGRTFYAWVDTQDVIAEAHDIPVPGYRNGVVNTLRLWSPRPVQEFDLALFNAGDHFGSVHKRNVAENISRVLYPNDSGPPGKELRLRQEYFFVSASLQDAVTRHLARWGSLDDLPEKCVFQLNDTHPALAVAEMMRLLMDEHLFTWERAWSITKRAFAYTNHTLMPEALETWPVHMLDRLLPRQLDIIREIDRRLGIEIAQGHDEQAQARMAIIERGPQPNVRMANLSIVGSFSVNGVSALHTQLLRERMFPELDKFFPGKFKNETNGVTPRRWIQQCNPELAKLITEVVGSDAWVTDLEKLRELEKHAGDSAFLERFRAIKRDNKAKLAAFLEKEHGFRCDPSSIFDIQIKRIHEYKRQLLNVLHVIHRYQRIKAGEKPEAPRTVIFGGKAASAYDMAKRIIHLINHVAKTINEDPEAREHLRVFFVPNYRVSYAERLIPAADLSEQISTAGWEASGTGNMKFAMNGAVTIGTLDGANIEIADAVGEDNILIFGMTAEQVIQRVRAGYQPWQLYESDTRLRAVIDGISHGAFSRDEPGRFRPVAQSLLDNDRFLLLGDFASYVETQQRAEQLFRDVPRWTRMSLLNVARMGRFSSDNTIRGYAKDIWGVL